MNALKNINKTEICRPPPKVEEPEITRTGEEPAPEIPFQQALELQI